jgi:hypothetical protein
MREHRYNGPEYDPARDNKRLDKQIGRIYSTMIDGAWRTLDEISSQTGDPQASVSAQLRHLRKERFGSYIVNRRARGKSGWYEYQLLKPAEETVSFKEDFFK